MRRRLLTVSAGVLVGSSVSTNCPLWCGATHWLHPDLVSGALLPDRRQRRPLAFGQLLSAVLVDARALRFKSCSCARSAKLIGLHQQSVKPILRRAIEAYDRVQFLQPLRALVHVGALSQPLLAV